MSTVNIGHNPPHFHYLSDIGKNSVALKLVCVKYLLQAALKVPIGSHSVFKKCGIEGAKIKNPEPHLRREQRLTLIRNKTRTSKVDAISKAQKAQNIFLKKTKFSKFFYFGNSLKVPKNVKGGPLGIY